MFFELSTLVGLYFIIYIKSVTAKENDGLIAEWSVQLVMDRGGQWFESGGVKYFLICLLSESNSFDINRFMFDIKSVAAKENDGLIAE